MRSIGETYLGLWPESDAVENFTWAVDTGFGAFSFYFRWFNSRWNCWVTLPGGEVREAGVFPGIPNWQGFGDYGVLFAFPKDSIGYNDLFSTALYIFKWSE